MEERQSWRLGSGIDRKGKGQKYNIMLCLGKVIVIPIETEMDLEESATRCARAIPAG